MKKIILLLLVFPTLLSAQDSFTWDKIHSWQVTFYKLFETVDVQVETFLQGDIIEVSWTQPLTTRPYGEQPEPIKFLNTGEFINIPVLRSDVQRFDVSGAVYDAEVSLSVGKWAIGVKAVMVETNDDGSNIVSKQSNWFPIYIGTSTKVPPDVPVSIGVRIKQ